MADHVQKRACAAEPLDGEADGGAQARSSGAVHEGNTLFFRDGIVALLPELRAFARFLARDRARADDLVQEAVLRAFAARDQFDPETSLKAWTFTILRNFFYEQGRRRKRELEVLEDYGNSPMPTSGSNGERDQLSDLDRMLWQLPPRQREALMLVGAQGMSYEEAAIICGVATGTIKARVSRARQMLVALRDGEACEKADV